MNTIKPTLPGLAVIPLNQVPAAPAPAKVTEPVPAPVEIDLSTLLADQQVDRNQTGKREGAGFDVKALNFEQMASKTLERIQQVGRPTDNAPIILKVGSSQMLVPGTRLNKDELVNILSDMLGKMSPEQLNSALDLAQAAQPLISRVRAESAAPPVAATQPTSSEVSATAAVPSIEGLFTGSFASEADFIKYSRGLLEGKLGVKSVDAGFIASYLHDAVKGNTVGKQVRGLGFVIVRLHELSQRDPKVKDALNRLIAQVEASVPAHLQPVFKKMFTMKGPSLGHINNLYTVSDGKFETAKDLYAAFELVHYFGSDVKAFLPDKAQRFIERVETLLAKETSHTLGALLKKFIPMGVNSDFSIALFKIAAGDSIARMSGALELGKLLGIRLFGDSGQFASLMSFAKIDIDTIIYARQLFDPASPGELKAKALKSITEIYQGRVEKFVAAFPAGTIPGSVVAEAEKLLALVPKDPVALTQALRHYGLENAEDITQALEKIKVLGVESEAQLLNFLQKMGYGKAEDALKALPGLQDKGIKSLEQLGEAFSRLGVKDAAGLDKTFKALESYGIKTLDSATDLLETLAAKDASEGLEALKLLGIKPGKLSAEALSENLSKALKSLEPHGITKASELINLMQRTGSSNLEELLKKLSSQGLSSGAEATAKLGLKTAAEASGLMSSLGSKTLEQAEAVLERFKAFGFRAEEVQQLLDNFGLKGSKDAEKALGLLKLLGVQASDDPVRSFERIKNLGIRYLDRAASDFQALQKFGVHSLEDAADAAKLLVVKHFDELGEGFSKLAKAGVENLDQANKLFKGLGEGVKNADDALVALSKLKKLGASTPEQAIELMQTLIQTNVRTADQAVELFAKLGIKNLADLDKFMPELEKLSQLGVNTGPELLTFISTLGSRNLKQAVSVLAGLEKAGIQPDKAIALAKRLGLEKTSLLTATLEKLGLQGDKIAVLEARLRSIGVEGLEKAVELLDKTGLKNVDDLLKVFSDFNIYDDKTLKAVMAQLGCGDDLAKLGSCLSKLKDLGIDHLPDALAFARKLGLENISEAVEIMAKFSKVGITQPEAVLKLLEKLGVNLLEAKPEALLAEMNKALALAEEAAKYGVKGADDLAEALIRTGAKSAEEIAAKMGDRALKVGQFSKAMGLSDEASGALVKLAQNGHMSEEVLEQAFKVFKTLGREKADLVARLLVHMKPDIVAALFKSEGLATKVLSAVAEVVPHLTKLGIGTAEIGAKLGKGILKALPALGIAVSGADMVRTKSIALTGEWTEIGLKGFGKKIEYNADARGLAAIAGTLNTVDTALAIAEWALPGAGPILTALPNIGLALTEVALDVMMDYYNEHPMPAGMKNVVEVAAYASAAAIGDIPTIIALNDSYGKAAEHSGQVIAQWLSDPKHKPAEVEHFIAELSKSWTRNDDATRELFKQLESKGISLDSLQKQSPPRLSQKALVMLFDNLNSTMTFNAGAADYKRMAAIGRVASAEVKAFMVTDLMNQQTNTDEETLIHDLILKATPGELSTILHKVDTAKLAGELEDPAQFKDVIRRVAEAGDASALENFIHSRDLSQDKATAAASLLLDTGVRLSDSQRATLFSRLSKGGDVKLLQQLLLGNDKLPPMGDKALINRMVAQAAARLPEFISVVSNDPRQAADLAVMVLLHGSQQQIDLAFKNINQNQWFGNGSDIVRTAIDAAGKQGISLKGKISFDSLQSLLGSVNNGWTKAFRAVGGTEHAKAEALILDLARLTDARGKAAIIQDMMAGWTPGSYETKIQTILRETTDPDQFTALVDRLDPATLSGELENRQELGVIMATLIERYTGDKAALLDKILNQWSSASIQSDDILYHLLKTLEHDGKLDSLKTLPNNLLDKMIDFTDDAFRDGNALSLDAESQWNLKTLRAAKQ